MSGVVILLLLVVAMALAGGWLWSEFGPVVAERLREQELVEHTRQADADVSSAARAARRAMNQAAGQAWRNRFE